MGSTVERADFGQVSVFFGTKNGKYPDGNQVVVAGRDTRVAFDTPVVCNRIGAEFDDSDLLILGHVHEDHIAGLHRLPDVPVLAHERDVDAVRSWDGLVRHYGTSPEFREGMLAKIRKEFNYLECPRAQAYRDGDTWEVGGSRIRAIHMPGHTSGHCVLLVEPEGVAFIGDIDLTGFGPYYGDATSNLREFRESLRRLPEIDARVWVTSHHRGVYTDRDRMLESLALYSAKIDERTRRLRELLEEKPRTLEELVDCRLIYPPGFEELWVTDAERRSISMHLEELLEAGEALADDEGRWRLRGS